MDLRLRRARGRRDAWLRNARGGGGLAARCRACRARRAHGIRLRVEAVAVGRRLRGGLRTGARRRRVAHGVPGRPAGAQRRRAERGRVRHRRRREGGGSPVQLQRPGARNTRARLHDARRRRGGAARGRDVGDEGVAGQALGRTLRRTPQGVLGAGQGVRRAAAGDCGPFGAQARACGPRAPRGVGAGAGRGRARRSSARERSISSRYRACTSFLSRSCSCLR